MDNLKKKWQREIQSLLFLCPQVPPSVSDDGLRHYPPAGVYLEGI